MTVARTLGIWLSALLLAQPLAAQDGGRRHFALVGQDQGLPPAAVQNLTQDQDGFLWMASENGLLRYEGGQVRRWATADGLPTTSIGTVRAIPGGGLWVETAGGVVRFLQGRFEAARSGAEVLTGGTALDDRGRLWITAPDGLYVQREGVRFVRLAQGRNLSKPQWAPRLGAMLVPTDAGLGLFRPDGTARAWGKADGLPEGGLQLAAEDGRGRIWGAAGRFLVMKEPGADRFTDQSALMASSLTPNGAIFTDLDGSLWLPTQNGALHLGLDRTERLDASGGLPFKWVRSMFRDRENTLWLVGPGVARLQGERVWNYNLDGEVFGQIVWAILRDADGSLLAGTDDGAARLGPAGLRHIPGTEGNRIKGLARDREGTLWMVGTIGSPLWLKRGAARADKAPLGRLGFHVNAVMTDAQGVVWLSHSTEGLLRWDAAASRLVQEVGPGFVRSPNLSVFKTVEDGRGRLWCATNRGLLVRDRDGRWQAFGEADGLRGGVLHSLALLPDGSAWVTYQEPVGLTRVRVEGGRLAVLGHMPFSHIIYASLVDKHGQTWVSTDQGLDRLEPPLHVGALEGMASEDCSINALLAEEGRVWVGTSGGLVRFDLGGMETAPEPPRAHILGMDCGSQRLEPPFGALPPVSYRDATVTFRIASPAYVNEHDMHFQVRLKGLEDHWRDPGSRMVRYPALRGGHYTFEVRAAQGGGPFGPVIGLAFEVRPPWWQSWWAYLLGFAAFVAGLLAVERFRLGALARSKAELEALVALRTRELMGRNEELSAALGNVKQLSGLLPICASCKKIRDDSGYWNQLESYLHRHTDVDFSHGICPECAVELFPELSHEKRVSRGDGSH